jgi:hypothetical protein
MFLEKLAKRTRIYEFAMQGPLSGPAASSPRERAEKKHR